MVYAIAGKDKQARKIARELGRQQKPGNLALGLLHIYAALGDRENVLQWLEEYHFEDNFAEISDIPAALAARSLLFP